MGEKKFAVSKNESIGSAKNEICRHCEEASKMIQEPLFIILILTMVVIGAQWWSTRFRNAQVMRYIPTPVWCYVPPTVLTTLGILPAESGVYDWISRFVLPACLILLLMTTDIKGLKKMGRFAFITILASTLSILLGAVAVFVLFRGQLGLENWKMVATLTASWVGGTANELAVKEATGLSDTLFAPLFIADITAVYIWMTLLMVLSSSQHKIDRFIHADRKQMELILYHGQKTEIDPTAPAPRISTPSLLFLLLIGFGLGIVSTWIGSQIPEIGIAVNRGTWIIITVTTVGLALAFTRYAGRQSPKATKVGFILFYFVLASTGAKANLLAILNAPFLLGICLIWMAIHGILLLGFGKLLRIPVALLATASQANLGGVVSAPIVASTYEPKLVSLAILLAIFGYAIGNYAGILTAQVLQLIGG